MALPLASPTAQAYAPTNADLNREPLKDRTIATDRAPDDGLYHPNEYTAGSGGTQAILDHPLAAPTTQPEQIKEAPRIPVNDGFYHPVQGSGGSQTQTKVPEAGLYHPPQAANSLETSAPTGINPQGFLEGQRPRHTQKQSTFNTLVATTLATQTTVQSLSTSATGTQSSATNTSSEAPSSHSGSSSKLDGVYAAISILLAVGVIVIAVLASARRKKKLLKAALKNPDAPIPDDHHREYFNFKPALLYLKSFHHNIKKHDGNGSSHNRSADEKTKSRESFFRLSLKLDGKHNQLRGLGLKEEFLESITSVCSDRTMVEPDPTITTTRCEDKVCKPSEQCPPVKSLEATKNVPGYRRGIFHVEMDFRPLKPGQVKLQRGSLAAIYEVFENGWVFCILNGNFQQGLAPRACFSGRPISNEFDHNLPLLAGPSSPLVGDPLQHYARFYPRFPPNRIHREPSETNMVPRSGSGVKAIVWPKFR
ncbi:hypothetical protein FE257_002702 [Aspergillus nanangensis]|uniref:SH3 domain-containing protein n=1 Tax=Aspergillus nanangensis TaxID=2582783 RepID=A0AAD4GN74_ASPNN|nr:hypothetical protein FE257_002702 [Aspergillus nanangensis]